MILDELTDLYIQSGRLQDAIAQAEDLLKQNPDNLDARRMLGRIYPRAISNPQDGHVDQSMSQTPSTSIRRSRTKTPRTPRAG